MQAQLRNKSDIKLLMLYLLKKIGYPLDYVTYNDICTVDGLIGSFDFTECFAELIDAGNIREFDGAGEDLFTLSEQGHRVIDGLESSLMKSLRDQAYKSALSLIDFRKSGRRMEYSTGKSGDGKPVFTCSVTDNRGVLLSISASLETEDQLDRVVYNWGKRPESIYRAILGVLNGDVNYIL